MLPTRNIASTNPNTMIFLIVKLITQPFQKRLYSLTLQHSAFLKKAQGFFWKKLGGECKWCAQAHLGKKKLSI
jgi:hypothetical protein